MATPVSSAGARMCVFLLSLRREDGQTLSEYAMILALLAVGVVASVGTLRSAVTDALSIAANTI